MIDLNHVIIRNVNLHFLIYKFSKKFASCAISSLIDFFSDYDQIELKEKS